MEKCTLGFGFDTAILLFEKGERLTRKGWNRSGMWIELQKPDENSKMTRPYLYHCSRRGSTNHYGSDVRDVERVPWSPSNTDIFARDWIVAYD